ncbi:spermidine synthase [Phenylobacterium sp.]|uniref:spermidine synthase n=1 Tax=Phenylobacterium sp. TaxID=1871053 RepID=UPI0027363BDE|nr:MnmC family methyltransferase [Phenylobacterium sp.]MDP3855072.1 MnmC family methyltransferase [Phenylobacterium sp.]
MIRWSLIDTTTVPDGGGDLRLMRRGEEFSIMSGAIELMNSRLSGSEKALATLACDRLQGRPRAHVLIGGFGMGFTLRAALEALGPQAQVTVGELVPAVIAWARGPMAHISGACLEDPRLTLREGDVAALIGAARASYDAILLDVDNGPEGLSRKANDRLYDVQGLAAARRALTPGGVLAVWSSAPSAAFTQRLRRAGFAVEELTVRSTGGKRGARHVIWLATAPARA